MSAQGHSVDYCGCRHQLFRFDGRGVDFVPYLFYTNEMIPMGRDYPAGSSRDDQSTVSAWPGCAIVLPTSNPAIECVARRGHLLCRSKNYRACEMRDNSCVALQNM